MTDSYPHSVLSTFYSVLLALPSAHRFALGAMRFALRYPRSSIFGPHLSSQIPTATLCVQTALENLDYLEPEFQYKREERFINDSF